LPWAGAATYCQSRAKSTNYSHSYALEEKTLSGPKTSGLTTVVGATDVNAKET